jgi:hypothetical protein
MEPTGLAFYQLTPKAAMLQPPILKPHAIQRWLTHMKTPLQSS